MPAPHLLRRLFDAPYLLLALTSLLWAGNFVVGRYVAGHVPPLTLALLRWVGATLIVLPFSYAQVMRDLPVIRAHFWSLLLLAATGISCFNAMSYYALQYTEALNGLLLQSMAPLLVGVWSFALFRDRLSLGQAAGILTSLCGVLLIISRGEVDTLLHLKPNIGDVWILIALLIYAFYAAILRTRPPLGGLSFLTVIMALGALLLAPFGLWEALSGHVFVVDTQSLLALAYVMVGPSLVAYLFFNRAVELVGANTAAPFLHLMPVFGTGLAIAFLGEQVAWFHLGGYALVITGIALATFAARKARPKAAPEGTPTAGDPR
ncbi:DMT family transporter [Xanthobacter sediminis]|uniref:DMT family transporter n=1 Tax=Xanthobacter sediminis TaxID=3119926 RepID=UPI00372CDBCC